MTKVFPITLIVLEGAATAIYVLDQDWRRALFWLCTAALMACVTF